MSKFQDAMRRVIAGDNAEGQSVIIIELLTAVPRPKSAIPIWADCSRSGRTQPSGL